MGYFGYCLMLTHAASGDCHMVTDVASVTFGSVLHPGLAVQSKARLVFITTL